MRYVLKKLKDDVEIIANSTRMTIYYEKGNLSKKF